MIITVTANAAIDKRYVVNGFQVNAVNRIKDCRPSAGGKGLNVSRVAMISGAHVTATGFTGGHAGAYIESEVEKLGIVNAFVRCKGESRSCLNIWDEVNKTQTEFLEPGFTVTKEDMERLIKKYTTLMENASVVTISGSMPSGCHSVLYKDMLRIGREHGKKVILDTSGKALEECLDEKPYMIKPNMDEIRMLTNMDIRSEEELLKATEDLHKKGIPNVVVSRGGDGSLMSCEDGVYVARVPKIEVMNTVGCGDSMIAGFAVGIEKGMPMAECLRFASAISAASALREETGFFLTKDMEALMNEIIIVKIG